MRTLNFRWEHGALVKALNDLVKTPLKNFKALTF